MAYIITLIIFIALYVTAIYLMKFMHNPRLTTAILVALVFIPYVMLSHTVYFDVGFYDWNFQNTLPTANVSPFMFTAAPLALFLPKKAREYFLLLISLLSVGMLAASTLGCLYNASINYKFHIHFTYDFLSHFAISLLGIYAVRSNQVTLNPKNVLISASIILIAATTMLVLNVIFDTAFFGLSLNGKHNIYNNVPVDNSYLSALIYYLGLVFVLLLGYAYSLFFSKKSIAVTK